MKKLLASLFVLATAFALRANPDGYFMLALHSPGELPVPTSSINGGRLSVIYGDCQNINGLDLGLAGRVRERMNGAEFNLLYSYIGTEFNGFQAGIVNFDDADFAGFQLGGGNVASSAAGLQLGLVNTVGFMAGCQIGLFNWADSLDGCQIGLVNVVYDQTLYVLPFVNAGW